MADKNEILISLLNQPPYVVRTNTEDFIERLHREKVDDKDFTDRFNNAVKSNLGFNVSISTARDLEQPKK
jgi:hypothetical protein